MRSLSRLVPMLLAALVGVAAMTSEASAQFRWRTTVEVTNTSGTAKTNEAALVTLQAPGFDYSRVGTNGVDIRFREVANGSSPDLPYFIETYNTSGISLIWVRVPSLAANETRELYMFHGDPGLTTPGSDFASTFPNAFVSSGNVTLGGAQNYDWFELRAGDQIQVQAGQILSIRAPRVIISGDIIANGAGSSGGTTTTGNPANYNGQGPGGGGGAFSFSGAGGGGGGGYGGRGGGGGGDAGDAIGGGGGVYGVIRGVDVRLGSGGGSALNGQVGGAGGGAVDARGTLVTVTGSISADGEDGADASGRGGGGGSGGTILVGGCELQVSGTLTANGGDGGMNAQANSDGGGGGGGGRVKLAFEDTAQTSSVTLSASGGTAPGNATFQQVGSNGLDGTAQAYANEVFEEIDVNVTRTADLEAVPVFTVTKDGELVPDGGRVFAATNALVSTLDIEIGLSDPESQNVTVTTTISNITTQGFSLTEWQANNRMTPFVLRPTAGAMSERVEHVIEMTATDSDSLTATFQFSIIVGPEIQVERDGTEIADGGVDSLATLIPQSSGLRLTYDILSPGPEPLVLANAPDAVEIISVSNGSALVVQQPSSASIPSEGADSFVIFLQPAMVGPLSVFVRIENNDSDEDPYEFEIQGTVAPAPEFTLLDRFGESLVNGATHDIGRLISYEVQSVEYTVRNDGTATLQIDTAGVEITDSNGATVTVVGVDTGVIGPGGTATIELSVEPVPSGEFWFTMMIPTNDADEADFVTTAHGNATTLPQPELRLERPEYRGVPDGATHNLGALVVGVDHTFTLTLRNIGAREAMVVDASVFDAINATVTVGAAGGGALPVLGTATIELTVRPESTGDFSFGLIMPNDSALESPYNVTMTGTALSSAQPEIVIERIDNWPLPTGATDTIGLRPADEPTVLVYWIRNLGAAPLTLDPQIGIANRENCSVEIPEPLSTTLAPLDGISRLVLRIQPAGGIGSDTFSFDLTVNSDDADESAYTITVMGNVPPTPIEPGDSRFLGCGYSLTGEGSLGPWVGLILSLLALGLIRRRAA